MQNLKELVLSDARLGSLLSILFNALGVARIQQLDVSNNEIGGFGARLLSKALQLNTSLRVLALDRNQTTAEGFAEIAHGLKLNSSVTSIPFPALDLADALARPDRAKALAALADIEAALERNRQRVRDFDLCAQKALHNLNNVCERNS